MILDTSAVVAILFRESGYEELLVRMSTAGSVGIGAPTLVETGIVVCARIGEAGRGIIARFLDEGEVEVLPFTAEHYGIAVGAWLRFGRGRHKAALNLGDCNSYAVATVAKRPLLFVGDDFSATDLPLR